MSKPGSENHEDMNKRRRKSESDIVGETTKLWPASLSSAQVKFRESEIESQSVGDNGLKPTSPNWAKVKVKR